MARRHKKYQKIPKEYQGRLVGVLYYDGFVYRFTAYLPEDAHHARVNLRGYDVILRIPGINETFCRRAEVFARNLIAQPKFVKEKIRLEDIVREVISAPILL